MGSTLHNLRIYSKMVRLKPVGRVQVAEDSEAPPELMATSPAQKRQFWAPCSTSHLDIHSLLEAHSHLVLA